MAVTLIIWFLFLHWFADFFCQTDYIAINKGKDLRVLFIHSVTYFLVLWVGYTIYFYNFPPPIFWLNFSGHFIIDFFTSRINAKLYEKHRHWFFTMIGFDQLLHYALLFFTLKG